MIKERLGSLGSAGEGGVRGGSYPWGLSVINGVCQLSTGAA